MTIIDCLLSTILTVSPTVPVATYAPPVFRGACVASLKNTTSHHIDKNHQLILVYAKNTYVIPLPPFDGKYSILYMIGTERADIKRVEQPSDPARREQQVVDNQWLHVMVRRGPSGGM